MEKKPRKISEKNIKIIAIVAIVAIVVIVLLWGMVPDKIYDVSEILDNQKKFNGKEVNIIGIVKGWEHSSYNFSLVDSWDNSSVINITHTGAFPQNFGNDETVVIIGIFLSEMDHIQSQKIQIGCPSKY